VNSGFGTKRRVMIGCGGTGGHIFPGIALGQELREMGCEVLFVGNRDGMEASLIPGEGFAFKGINVQKLYRKISISNLLFPFLLASATLSSRSMMKKFKPQGVICTGGFVSGPVALAAIMLKVPLFFHESNSYPGMTTRYLAKYTKITFTSFSGTQRYLSGTNVRELGIPLPKRKNTGRIQDLREIGLSPEKPIILITGGSQGSQAINSAVAEALPKLIEKGFQIIWQTGKTGFSAFTKRFKEQKGLYLFDFSPQLPSYFLLAQVAITRAGALTIAELEQSRLPAVLIPLPTAAENHQYYNALEQQEKGLALILQQKDLTPENLITAIHEILDAHEDYKSRLAKLPPNNASLEITRQILEYLDKEKSHAGKN